MLFVGPRQSSLYLDTTCKQFFEISNASNPLSSLVSPLINKNKIIKIIIKKTF
jgi:hypothetical protein